MFDSLQWGSTNGTKQYERKILLPWQQTGFQTSPVLTAFLATFSALICKWCLVCMIQQAQKYVSFSLWPCLAFSELKITNILKSSGQGLEQSELPWEHNFHCHRCVSQRTISLPSFNDLHCKLAKRALFIVLRKYWVECMTSSVISFAYFTPFSNLNISGTNADICKH